jgi:uncharacterized zinc-type alcohol dehydrogenase-like protein
LKGTYDLILDTVSADHDMDLYLRLLKLKGVMVMVGLPTNPLRIAAFALLSNNRSLVGSSIGGIPETQEMLDYCAANNIVSDVEVIDIRDINEAYERMLKGDVKYRFVIDMSTL